MQKEEYLPSMIKLSIPSLTYSQNEEELQLASYSELMRLLYVAMTRAEKKLYLVGKGSREKLESKEYPDKWERSFDPRNETRCSKFPGLDLGHLSSFF